MSKYRNRLQIIADILSIANSGARKTRIMFHANLSYRLLCRYLGDLLDSGLVEFEANECYVITVKGKEFLSRHVEYSKRRKNWEEHLNLVNGEKSILEQMCHGGNKTENRLHPVVASTKKLGKR